jgi:hypothetical protein
LEPILREVGDLRDETKKEFMDPKPTFGDGFVHGRIFGVVEVGEDRGLIRSFAQVMHEFGIGFAARGDAAKG